MFFGKIIKILKKWFKKHWRWLVLISLAIAFFIGVSSFNYITQQGGFTKWLSPDETANYTFAKFYGQEGGLTIFEKYNLYTRDIMHPRSFRSDHGFLKPVSFLGIILIYGQIVSLTSYKILPYLTPFFAALGIIYFYLLIKKIFGSRNAYISTFLLVSFPPFIYYSARSMFHNVLFIVLLIIGLYYGMLMVKKRKETKLPIGNLVSNYCNWFYAALSGGFIGLAVITRTSELLWLVPMLIILWIFNIKKTGLIKLLIFLSFLLLTIIPSLCWNQILYSSPWLGGYPEMNQSIANITQAGSDLIKSTAGGNLFFHKDLFYKIKDNIFYFGFHPYYSLKMIYHYFASMFYWLFGLAFLGGILLLIRWRKWKRKHWAYLISYFIVSLILLFYYGSWNFHDNPDPGQFTIGNSYTRYWLPIYLGAIPFASLFIIKLTRLAKKKFYISASRVAIIILIFFLSGQFVLFGSAEGLIFSAHKQKQAREEWSRVLDLTEHNSTIITIYHDKLFFPERKVIVGLFDDKNMIAEYANLVNLLPVYYYNFTLPPRDFEYLNNRRLAEAGLQIEKVEQVTDDFTLYRLEKQ